VGVTFPNLILLTGTDGPASDEWRRQPVTNGVEGGAQSRERSHAAGIVAIEVKAGGSTDTIDIFAGLIDSLY
jgi:hypothetical protein